MKIEGKNALVLGAVKGIGKAVALDLARRGAHVAINYWDWEEHLPALRRDFETIGVQPLVLKTDLLDTESIAPMVARVAAQLGGLDILVNNIERGGWPVVHGAYVREQWDMEQATTLRAKRWVFEAALPHLKADPANGHDWPVIAFQIVYLEDRFTHRQSSRRCRDRLR